MKTYFIHSCKNNENIEVYGYLNGQLLDTSEIDSDQLLQAIEPNSIVNYLLPSDRCIVLNGKKNESETEEVFKARFLMEHEHELIDDVSNNSFAYSDEMGLVALAATDVIRPINDLLNQLASDARIIPEHFLLHSIADNACIEHREHFVLSFSDGSGFCTNEANLESYLTVLNRKYPDYKPHLLSKNKILQNAFSDSVEDNASLFDLHGHLMSESQPVFPNFFRGYFSIKSIFRKLDLTRNQVGLSTILLALLIALPMTNILLMDSYERQYRQKINQTFLSINPNFRRVINPRAQMDELLRNQPSPQTGRIDLNAFAYLRALDLENITRTSIDFETTIMLLELNDLPQIKYALIERLIEESGMMIISDELVKTDSSVSGVIRLRYSFE